MTRIVLPLDPKTTAAADDVFYRNHPELVAGGKRRPVDPDRQPTLAAEWRSTYTALAQAEGTLKKEESAAGPVVQCPLNKPQPKDYLHCFVLVPGTTMPVNNLFDFMTEHPKPNPSGGGYWTGKPYAAFVPAVKALKAKADAKNKGDPEYHSDLWLDFAWSGHNSHDERVKAGRRLAGDLWGRYADWRSREVYFHLIGHSHGGNVINDYLAALGGKDPKIHCGDRWFVKSITYLSTPFFQKIEQPRKTRVHGSAVIFNIHNYYDLTQLCIADFTVQEAGDGLTRVLAGHIKEIKTAFGKISADLGAVRAAFADCFDKFKLLKKEQAWDLMPGVDNAAAVRAADAAYQTACGKLNGAVAQLKGHIDAAAVAVIALLDKLRGLLQAARADGNGGPVEELLAFVEGARGTVAGVQVTAQNLIGQAARFDIAGLIQTMLTLLRDLLAVVAALLQNDLIFKVLCVGGVHILQFFDDTLQTNDHYSELRAFSQVAEPVAPRDRYTKRAAYQRLRDALEPRERALHSNYSGITSVPAFARGKWDQWPKTQANLIPLFKTLIAQVAARPLRAYKQYPQDLQRQAEKLREWNATADTWVPGYQGAAADAYCVSIATSARTIVAAIDGLLALDFTLFDGTDPLAADDPGTLPYVAIVSHSVSRETLSEATTARLAGTVTRG